MVISKSCRTATRFIRVGDLAIATSLVALAIAILHRVWGDILRIALKDEECSYVLIAPIVILWLGWVRRRRLLDCPWRNGWVGLLGVALGWGVYWYGFLNDPIIWRAGAVFVAAGAFMAGVGFDASRRLAPAIIACVFLIPVDPNGRYHVAEPLQTITANVTQWISDLFGMSVGRSGNLLTINGVDVTIAEACNGMRMVLTLFLVCYVVAFTLPLRRWQRFVVLAGSPVVAIASNVVRLVPTLWMFGHESQQAAQQFHNVSGWVMTVMAFAVLMSVVRLFHHPHRALQENKRPTVIGDERSPGEQARPRASAKSFQMIGAFMLAGIAFHNYIAVHKPADVQRYQAAIRAAAAKLPVRAGSWISQDVEVPQQSLRVLRPNVMISRRYVNVENGVGAGLLLVHCGEAHDMVGHFPLRCYPAEGWQMRNAQPRDWTVGDLAITGTEYEFHRTTAGDTSEEQSIIVDNFLLRPGGRILRDMDGMSRTIVGAGGSSSGAGQIQIYFDAAVSPAQRDSAIQELAKSCLPIIKAILADPSSQPDAERSHSAIEQARIER